MSDWTWKYVPDAANVIGGLTHAQIDEVESLASRIADAVAVRRIGVPFDVRESVSSVKSYGEGPVVIWFLEDYRDDVVLVVRYSTSGCLTRQINCVGQAVASSTAVDATITIWASRLIGASSASPCLPQRYGPVPWIRPSDCAEHASDRPGGEPGRGQLRSREWIARVLRWPRPRRARIVHLPDWHPDEPVSRPLDISGLL